MPLIEFSMPNVVNGRPTGPRGSPAGNGFYAWNRGLLSRHGFARTMPSGSGHRARLRSWMRQGGFPMISLITKSTKVDRAEPSFSFLVGTEIRSMPLVREKASSQAELASQSAQHLFQKFLLGDCQTSHLRNDDFLMNWEWRWPSMVKFTFLFLRN